MRDQKNRFYLILILSGILSACHINRFLEPTDRIYTGATIELKDRETFDQPRKTKLDLQELTRPKASSKFGLWTYYAIGNPKREKGFWSSLKKRFGEPPVFYDESEIYRSSLIMQKYLKDQGHFLSNIAFDTIMGLNSVYVKYQVTSEGRFSIRHITLPPDTLRLPALIKRHQVASLLKTTDYYSLSKLIGERARITEIAKNEGYFDFDEEDLFYFVDTNAVRTPGQEAVDIWLQIKEPSYGKNYKQYKIGHSYVYPNYDLSRASSIRLGDTLSFQDLTILQNTEIIKPRTLREAIVQKEGDFYSEERQRATSNHLLDLGIYKFVNIKYRKREADSTSILDRFIYLTPGDVQTVSAEIGANTRPGFFGMAVKGKYSHNNVFHGAERLDLSLSTGFENGGRILIGEDTLNNNLVEFTARADLSIPRFVVPFVKIRSGSSFHIPRTVIGLLANFQRRRKLFTLSGFRGTFGYDWAETRHKRHQFTLFSINFVRIRDKTAAFNQYLDENPSLKNSFSDQFILGPSYTYTYTNQEINTNKNYFFLLAQLETSGNLTYLLYNSFNGGSQPYRLFGTRFSNFTKLDLDLRYNLVGKKNSLVFRFSPGFGLPYLNSDILPYTKQYYLGGSNSLRGFPIRGLLGSFQAEDNSEIATSAFDHTGEVKIEFNSEFRFDAIKPLYLKGAFFMDVGNVWRLDPQNLETDTRKVFSGNRFIKELAVGAGFGLRFDIQYVVVRFDTALPLRKPFLPEKNRWTFGDFGKPGWISDNITFNIALGYPF